MPILLCSLGATWAVVPEAFQLRPPGPSGFTAVHVLTSDSPATDKSAQEVIGYFASRYPAVELTIAHVADFVDLSTAADHALFEEVLLRWILARAPEPASRYICLAGGFKTMSVAMQRAAGLLGAAEVFHVLAAHTVNTPDLVDQAAATGGIAFVRLGYDPGWPSLAALKSSDFPLNAEPRERIRAPGYDLSNHIAHFTADQRNLAQNFHQLDDLPFPLLATYSPGRLAWLNQPFKPSAAGHQAWLASLPKIELHCHLGGFATQGDTLTALRATASRPELLPDLLDRPFPSGWPTPSTPCGLDHYMALGDNNGSRLLRDPACLRTQCEHLYAALVADGVLYAEIRCSPNNYATPDRSAWDVLADIRSHFERCMAATTTTRPDRKPACHVNLIVIATRKDSGDRSDISRHLSLAITAAGQWRDDDTCRVVGVDLAGFEHRDTRAALFATDFEAIHRVGLAVTIHAGENDDAEGIWQAVFKLNARRLGHALHLKQSPDLMRSVADRTIAVEMCPYANLQIKGYALDAALLSAPAANQYPLLSYLRAGVRVTVNTDNIGISAASLTDNLLLATRLCPGLTPLDLLHLQRNALDAAFVSPALRSALTTRFTTALHRHA
jgi:adenosine deaminase